MTFFKITNQNLLNTSKTLTIFIKTQIITCCIKTQRVIYMQIKVITYIKIKTISIPSNKIYNKIKINNQLLIIILHNNHHLYQDKITLFLKTKDNQKNKNYKTHPHTNKTLLFQRHNLSKDQSKQNNKNPSLIKDNSKNLNYNNNLDSIKIHSGDKITKTGLNKDQIKINKF